MVAKKVARATPAVLDHGLLIHLGVLRFAFLSCSLSSNSLFNKVQWRVSTESDMLPQRDHFSDSWPRRREGKLLTCLLLGKSGRAGNLDNVFLDDFGPVRPFAGQEFFDRRGKKTSGFSDMGHVARRR